MQVCSFLKCFTCGMLSEKVSFEMGACFEEHDFSLKLVFRCLSDLRDYGILLLIDLCFGFVWGQ